MPDGCCSEDGTFWISFNDVLKYFDCIDICKARHGWNEVRLTGILPPLASQQHLSCIYLTILEPTEVDFTLFQVIFKTTQHLKHPFISTRFNVIIAKTSCFAYN